MNSLLTENAAITQYDFDPDATTATEIAWVDMRDYERFCVTFFRTVGTSDLTLRILGNSASNGGGTDVVLATKTFTAGQPNAVGDYVFLEVGPEDFAAGSETGTRYVTAECTVATGTDEGVVTYVRFGANHPQSGLSSDSIA